MALTRNDFTGDNVTTVYDVAFSLGFLKESDIFVSLDSNEHTNQIGYSFLNSTQIVLDSPVDSGVGFNIRRVVDRSQPINDYEEGAILRENNLDDSFVQALMILQEIEDGYIEVDGTFNIVGDLNASGEVTDGNGNVLSEKMQNRPDADHLNIVVFDEDGNSEDSGVSITGLESGEGFAFTESKTLTDGQIDVNFNLLNPITARFVICGDGVDSTTLCAADYTVIDSSNVTLTDSYPAGTVLMGIQNEQTADIERGVRYFSRPMTVAEAVAATNVQEGDTVIISDRGNGLFEYKTGQVDNTFSIVACTGIPSLSLVLRVEAGVVTAGQIGANGLVDSTAAINAAIGIFTSGPLGGGKVLLDAGVNYTTTAAIVIPPNITLDCQGALITYTGAVDAFELGTSDTVLSYDCKLLNLNLKLEAKNSKGVILRGTARAHVTGRMEGHTDVLDNTRSNVGLWVDGRDVSSFFNRITLSLNHMHEGFRVETSGTVQATTQYFESCDTLGDQSTDDTSIGYSFGLNGTEVQEGQGTIISGGNVELCNTAFLIGSKSGRVTVLGVRIEISITGTAWKFDFRNGCDPWSLIGVNGLGTTYMGSASGIKNFDSAAHMLLGGDTGEMRLNGFDKALDNTVFIGQGGAVPQIWYDSGADMALLLDDDNTGAGRVIVQAGSGSADRGGGYIAHGHSHASNAGDMHVFASLGAGEFKVTSGLGGSQRFRVSSTEITPGADNTSRCGSASLRYTEIFAANGTINTSDGRYKTAPISISDAVLDAWQDVNFVEYQMIESINSKGADSARLHFGVVAQQVKAVFEAHGLDPFKYGLLCYDEWEDNIIRHEAIYTDNLDDSGRRILDERGDIVQGDLIQEAWDEEVALAGNRYGIRYEECMVLESALMRRELSKIKSLLN